MPADRKRKSNKKAADSAGASSIQLTWTMPVEAEAVTGLEFAQSLTPSSYKKKFVPTPSSEASGDAARNAPPEPTLFPHTQPEPDAPRKPTHQKKKAENHIPRPPNAFILFRSSFIKSNHVSNEVETDHSQLSKIIGMTWQGMPEDERKFWHAKAIDAQAEHKKKYPNYAFRPAAARGAATKRKVRADMQRDGDRCARIAQLLVEGKKGAEIDEAMAEFDKQNAKPVIARFEEPVTAREFRRRSCSQPPPEMQPLFTTMQFVTEEPTQPSSSRRKRANSSQPSVRRTRSRTAVSTPAPESEASTPVASSPAPSSPFASASSLADVPEDYEMPPLVLPPPNFEYSQFSFDPSHSFGFDGFSFDAAASHAEVCDSVSPVTQSPTGEERYGEQMACATYASLSIDTSFFNTWNIQQLSSPYSSSPAIGCSPIDQPPPFSALTPVAAPEYSHTDYLPIAPTDAFSGQMFESGFGSAGGYTPAPPYPELANFGTPSMQVSREWTLSKGDYPYYEHKVVDDPQQSYALQNSHSYPLPVTQPPCPPQAQIFNYSL